MAAEIRLQINSTLLRAQLSMLNSLLAAIRIMLDLFLLHEEAQAVDRDFSELGVTRGCSNTTLLSLGSKLAWPSMDKSSVSKHEA